MFIWVCLLQILSFQKSASKSLLCLVIYIFVTALLLWKFTAVIYETFSLVKEWPSHWQGINTHVRYTKSYFDVNALLSSWKFLNCYQCCYSLQVLPWEYSSKSVCLPWNENLFITLVEIAQISLFKSIGYKDINWFFCHTFLLCEYQYFWNSKKEKLSKIWLYNNFRNSLLRNIYAWLRRNNTFRAFLGGMDLTVFSSYASSRFTHVHVYMCGWVHACACPHLI